MKKTTKEDMERMCVAAGMQTQPRRTIEGKEVFIADGFSSPPHAAFGRFGLTPEEFPFGCFVTFWLTEARKSEIGMGRPLFFDALASTSRDRDARIREAVKDATASILGSKKKRMH